MKGLLESGFNAIEAKLVSWVLGKIVISTGWVAHYLLTTPVAFLSSPAFHEVYRQAVLIADMLLLPLTAAYGFAVIMGWGGKEVGGAANRLFLAAIGTNASPWAIRFLVEVGNTLAQYVSSSITFNAPAVKDAQAAEIGLLIFLVVYLYLVIRLTLHFAYRNFALVALAALSPLIWVAFILPGQQHRAGVWAKQILSLVLTQVVHAIELALLVQLTLGPAAASKDLVETLLFQIGALLYMVETPAAVKGWVDDGAHVAKVGRAAFDLLTLRQLRRTFTLKGAKA